MPDNPIHLKLDHVRRSLLDLSRRNRLLNFRPRGTSSLQIVDEVASEIYRILVNDQQSMQFLALEESELYDAESESLDQDQKLDANRSIGFSLPRIQHEATADRHSDEFLQTSLEGEKLQKRLLKLSRESESALQERGTNVLFLAMGFLEWVDHKDSRIVSRAPILMVPVELTRTSANARFRLQVFDDAPQVNPCLVELCRQNHRIDFPAFDSDAEQPVDQLFDAVRTSVASLPAWSLVPEIHLGLFSFAKLLMYLDMDPGRWPTDRGIADHSIIQRLLGFGQPDPGPWAPFPPEELDDRITPHETFQVLDADSSQQAAIIAAKNECSMVIEGPPGTGKSQTITNIIAECLSEGKTVLFVAEKSAALEVVHRRLKSVQLGDFVIELHSRKASKKAFMEELRCSLRSEYHPPASVELDADQLLALRRRLNEYVRTLHRPIEPLQLSPFEALGRCAQFEHTCDAPFALEHPLSWGRARLQAAEQLIKQLSQAAARIGNPSQHAWRGTQVSDVAFSDLQKIPGWLASLLDAVKDLKSNSQALAQMLACDAPDNREACVKMIEQVQRLLKAPLVDSEQINNQDWANLSSQINQVLVAGQKLNELRRQISDRWKLEAELFAWDDLLKRQRTPKSFLDWLRPSYWSDRRQIRKNRSDKKSPDTDQLIQDLESLVRIAQLRDAVRQVDPVIENLFGPLWEQDRSDWSKLHGLVETIRFLRMARESNPETQLQILQFFSTETGRNQLLACAKSLVASLNGLQQAWNDMRSPLMIDAAAFLGGKPDAIAFSTWRRRVEEAAASVESIRDWTGYLKARQDCSESPDTGPFLSWLTGQSKSPPTDIWLDAFRRQFHRLWLDEAARNLPVLSQFRGEDHQLLIDQFRDLDRKWLQLSQARLAALAAQQRPRVGYAVSSGSDLGRLEAELRRKRRIKPIRQLLSSDVAPMIQQIKPCFMMSPISVAQYLAPGKLGFDVVIFDEASQVEVADAVGAISRGKQLLLVGDEKQLPPTNFFSTIDDSEADDEEIDDSIPIQDLESILSAGYSALPHRSTLRWHYRSLHHSLIHFSNSEFYDNYLRVFPSPVRDRQQLGLLFEYVADGVYDRGRSRCNQREAAIVAQAAIDHARSHPNLTLGIGAFSKSQQIAIEDHIEQLRRQHPDVEHFFSGNEDEPFFVKNLETIQGDERDVILLSIGYGPDAAGRMTMSFGPINADGGWRRLNVLVSRARQRCIVFSSIRADDIKVTPDSPRGVVALKRFLSFAQTGEMPTDGGPAGGHDSPFEESVSRSLEVKGWEVHSQIGCAGYSIDLAVVDPRAAGRYLVGIECDGASYHASATARDRDRIRESVLEDLGWDILRVWSTDWFRQPVTTLNRLDAAIRELLQRPPDGKPNKRPTQSTRNESCPSRLDSLGRSDRKTATSDGPRLGIARYKRYDGKSLGARNGLLRTDREKLAQLMVEIIATEGPIHQNELVRIVAGLYKARARGDARDHLARALNTAVHNKNFNRRGMFLWSLDMDRPTVRWRGDNDAPTSAEHIPVEEVAEAVIWVVDHDGGVPRDDLSTAAIRILGFKRAGSQLAELADKAIDLAIGSGRVRISDEGKVEIASESN